MTVGADELWAIIPASNVAVFWIQGLGVQVLISWVLPFAFISLYPAADLWIER